MAIKSEINASGFEFYNIDGQEYKFKSPFVLIKNYFKKANETLGFMINLSELQQQIYDLGYIDTIRTINKINDSNQAWVSGLSFAYFTPSIVNYADWEVITQVKQLEKFQYCELLNADQIISNIEIINENTFTLKASEF